MRLFVREAGVCGAAALTAMVFAATFALRDPSYFWRDDFQANYLPRFLEVARSLRQGEYPLLAPDTWQAGTLAGEFQFAVFSPWSLFWMGILGNAGLTFRAMAATLAIVHFGWMAAGACRLARGRGLPVAESLLVALVAALNGWVWVWGGMTWFVALAGLAWLPWAWWGLEYALAEDGSGGRAVFAGALIALVITAGWHFACLMIGLVSAVLLLQSVIERRVLRAASVLAIAWLVGLGLSAPAWLMLLEYSPWTLRGQAAGGQWNRIWSVPPRGLVGLLMPAAACTWSGFVRLRPHVCVELAGAFIPLVGIVATLARLGRKAGRQMALDLGVAVIALLLAMGPGTGGFRWSYRWLPLFFIALSLAAGEGMARLRREGIGAAYIGRWAFALAAIGLLIGIVVEEGSVTLSLWYGTAQIVACGLWCCAVGRAGKVAGPWIPLLLTLGSLALLYRQPDDYLEFPGWKWSDESSAMPMLSRDITYLGVYTNGDVYDRSTGLQDCLAGNSFLYRNLSFVNGYSPLRLAGLSQLFGFGVSGALSDEAAERLLHREADPDGLLQLLGIDGLFVIRDRTAPDAALRQQGWQPVAESPVGRVWQRIRGNGPRVRSLDRVAWRTDRDSILHELMARRTGPVPLFVEASMAGPEPELGSAQLRILREHRNGVEIAVEQATVDRPILVTIARPWYPGYVARLNGAPVPVYRLDLALPVVLLPPGANGILALEYRPAALRYGVLICGATFAGEALAVIVGVYRSARRTRQRIAPGTIPN